jgi:hypothetical protein
VAATAVSVLGGFNVGGVEAASLNCGLRADEPQCLSVITAGIRFGMALGSGSAAVAEAAA